MTASPAALERLKAIARLRPETKNAPAVWSDVLAPELERREDARAALLKETYFRTAIAATIAAIAFVSMAVIGAPIQVMFWAGIGVGFFAVAGLAGTRWVKVFSMKSETKTLILSAACEPFGFTYDTLHPDLKNVESLSDLNKVSKAYAKSNYNKKFATSYSEGHANKHAPPTPAFKTLKEANLLPDYDEQKFEDLIQGKRAGSSFSLHEAKLYTTGKNGETKFQGLMFHVEYPQRFLGRTVVARSGFWKRKTWQGSLQRVHLVSKELEDAFTVYSNDQVEARALLTPDRMERLIALERHFHGGKLRAIFEDGHMTVALEAQDQFEAGSIFQLLVNPERFISALEELGLVCDLIDGFLTRDWVKGRI